MSTARPTVDQLRTAVVVLDWLSQDLPESDRGFAGHFAWLIERIAKKEEES